MGDLGCRMNPGIGATSPMQNNGMINDRGDRIFQGGLDRTLVRLTLPAMKLSSLVLQHKGNALGVQSHPILLSLVNLG
jgi:hypothetical protein